MVIQTNATGIRSLTAAFFLLTILVFDSLAQQKHDGFVKIFDGETFRGWDGDTAVWRIENGKIIGEVTADTDLKANTFLLWHGGMTNDFELFIEFRISDDGSSGINYRSERVKGMPYVLKGYQAAIDGQHIYTGQIYEERGRGFLAKRGEKTILAFRQKPAVVGSVGNDNTLKEVLKINRWNQCHIVARGNIVQHFINGVLMSEVTDNDKTLFKSSGILGLQLQTGPPMKVEFRNIMLKPLL